MQKKKLFLIIFTILSSLSFSQTLDQIEINSGGDKLTSQTSTLTISLGGVNNASFAKDGSSLSQGFLVKQKSGLITSINSENNHRYLVYPNPALTEIHIEGLNPESTYTVINTHGMEVITSKNSDQTINIENLHPGVYNIVFKQNNSISNQTFIKL